MSLKILIAEDKEDEFEVYEKVCNRVAKEMGFSVGVIRNTKSEEETFEELSKETFDYDVVIFDINLGENDIEVSKITKYFKNDILMESKILIHSGNAQFISSAEKIMHAVANGGNFIAKKGESKGVLTLEYHFKKILERIKIETVWSNIGRFTPRWKRELFRDLKLWDNLKNGKRERKVILICDIAHSTKFIQYQRNGVMGDSAILELFKRFANNTTEILERDEFRGIIERYSGDEVFAYFNIDGDNEATICMNAIKAAELIKENFNATFKELSEKYKYHKILQDSSEIKPQLRMLITVGEVTWILQGADTRPQLSIMTETVAKCYRTFHSLFNYERIVRPNNIYITHEVYVNVESQIDPETPVIT